MDNREDQGFAQVLREIDPAARLLTWRRLEGGMSAQMTLVEFEIPGQETQRLIVRRPGADPSHETASAEAEFAILALTACEPLRRNKPVLLHGDFWPGNWLWQAGRLVAVVDWEDARLGEPLNDLAITRLDMAWIFGFDAMHDFTEHYRSLMAIDYDDLPYWDLCAALRLIRLAGSQLADWSAFFVPFGRSDISEQSIREALRQFVEQALDQLPGR